MFQSKVGVHNTVGAAVVKLTYINSSWGEASVDPSAATAFPSGSPTEDILEHGPAEAYQVYHRR